MVRTVLTAALALTTAALAHAHFVFVVPDAKNPAKVMVVFSEDLEIDEAVPAERLNGLKLTGRFEGGKEAPVECKAGKSCLTAELGLVNPQAVFGTHTLGVMQKGDAKPFLLAYHAKAVFAGADPKHALLGAKLAPAELIPEAADGKVRFRFVAGGKPVADAVVTVIKPEGGKAKATTDKEGRTEAFAAKGRYGAWARHTVTGAGEFGGKKYDEARHYATLVIDLPAK